MKMNETEANLQRLTECYTKQQVTHIERISPSGSSRQYFRLFTANNTFIGTYNQNTAENEAFVCFAQHFFNQGLRVPQVYAFSDDKLYYIQSDLGDESLFSKVQQALMTDNPFDSSLMDYYRQSLSQLVDFQIKGHQWLDYSVAYPTSVFDKQSVLDDLNYFKYYFLKLHECITFNETYLDDDFNTLADFVAAAPSDFFMYRDFQSRNIMIANGKTYFIDFQGGRKGPLQYDVISLLYQAKARIPHDKRMLLIDFYKNELSKHLDIKALQFDYYFPAFVLVRLLQVAGAYGFRGLIQKKSHFIESIPFMLRQLRAEISNLPIDLPELKAIIAQFVKIESKYETPNDDILNISVNSFSYKNGSYPPDFTGNGGGFVFDCRALPNPGRDPRFKNNTGLDACVIDFLESKTEILNFQRNVENLIKPCVDNYIERGFKNLMISFGCTGGQHRSVYFAQQTFNWLKHNYPQLKLNVNHLAQNISHEYQP